MVCHRTDLGTASAEGPSNEGRVKGVREASVSAASGPSGQNSEGKVGKREAKEKRQKPALPAKRERRSRANGRVLKKGTAQPKGIQTERSGRSGCVSQVLRLKRVAIRDKKADRASVCRSGKEKRAETGPHFSPLFWQSEPGYQNPVFEDFAFIACPPLAYPEVVCSVAVDKILVERRLVLQVFHAHPKIVFVRGEEDRVHNPKIKLCRFVAIRAKTVFYRYFHNYGTSTITSILPYSIERKAVLSMA